MRVFSSFSSEERAALLADFWRNYSESMSKLQRLKITRNETVFTDCSARYWITCDENHCVMLLGSCPNDPERDLYVHILLENRQIACVSFEWFSESLTILR